MSYPFIPSIFSGTVATCSFALLFVCFIGHFQFLLFYHVFSRALLRTLGDMGGRFGSMELDRW